MFISRIAGNSAKTALAVVGNPAQKNVYKPWCGGDLGAYTDLTVDNSGDKWGQMGITQA
jgi:hypothetical protein